MVAEVTVGSWVELSIAMMTGTADSGSAGTVLFEFSCAMWMVSCGVAQELVVVGDFAVMVVVSGRVGGELFVWIKEEVLLRLAGVAKVVWRWVGSLLETWRRWLIGCIFVSLVIWWLLVVAKLMAVVLDVVVVVSREM